MGFITALGFFGLGFTVGVFFFFWMSVKNWENLQEAFSDTIKEMKKTRQYADEQAETANRWYKTAKDYWEDLEEKRKDHLDSELDNLKGGIYSTIENSFETIYFEKPARKPIDQYIFEVLGQSYDAIKAEMINIETIDHEKYKKMFDLMQKIDKASGLIAQEFNEGRGNVEQ